MSGSKYIRLPFEERECDKIEEELTLAEMKQAVVKAYNESVETADEGKSEDELSQYDSVRDIREDDSISPAERKRREIRAKRRHDIPNR